MKRILALLLCFVLGISVLIIPALAVSEKGFIHNGDSDFSAEQLEELKNKAEAIYLKYGVEVYFAKDFSYNTSSELGIYVLENSGEPGKGIMFANTQDRYSMDAYGGLQDVFTHDVTELIYQICCTQESYYEKAVAYYDAVEQHLITVGYPTLQPDPTPEQSTSRLTDNTGFLSETEFQNVLSKLNSTSETLGLDFAITVTDSLDNENGQSFCKDLYSTMGYGTGETKSGIMLAYNPSNLCCEIYTMGLGSNAVSESDKSALADKLNSDFKSGNNETAFLNFISQCETLINDTLSDNRSSTKENSTLKIILMCILPIVIIAGIIAGIVSARKKKHKA